MVLRRMTVLLVFLLVFLLASAGAPSRATEFIRGDVNGDRNVTVADAHVLQLHLLYDGTPVECLDAGDANDDGFANVTDIIALILRAEEPLPNPFPTPGPDPSEDSMELPCDSYGNGEPLEDPAARLQILDVTVPGGTDGTATITVAVSSSVPVAGYEGVIDISDGPIGGIEPESFDPVFGTPVFPKPTDLVQNSSQPISYAFARGDRVRFAYLPLWVNSFGPIPEGESTLVLEFDVCLEDGTPAGEYTIDLESGELADAATGRSIHGELVSGTLTILEDVQTGGECFQEPGDPTCPPAPGRPEDLEAQFVLGSGSVPPGERLEVPFNILANAQGQGYILSIDFDEEVLQIVDLDVSFETVDGTAYGFFATRIYNDNETPGSAGVDEGYLVAAAVFSFTDDCSTIPPNTPTEALRLTVEISSEAEVGSTEIRFVDGGIFDPETGNTAENSLFAYGEEVSPEIANSFVFIPAVLNVLPDGSVFIRGDTNGDDEVDLSDAVATLGYLFLGERRPLCPDAADANDDGRLDISDPVATLQYLFLDGRELPPPTGVRGNDPTEDDLGCYRSDP